MKKQRQNGFSVYTVLACNVSTSGAVKQSNTRYYYYIVIINQWRSQGLAQLVNGLRMFSLFLPFFPSLFLPSLSSFPFSSLSSPLLPFPSFLASLSPHPGRGQLDAAKGIFGIL